MIEQDVPIRTRRRKCFAWLLYDRVAGWMERNVEVQNAPAGMFDNEEAMHRAEIKVWNGEEVERRNHLTMVVQKSVSLAGFAFVRNRH